MFGFGKKKSSHSRIFETIFFPDGEVIKDGWYEAVNARLVQTYLDSVRRATLVQQLTDGQEAPFEAIRSIRERPLLVTLLMPAPSPALTDALLERQRSWVASLIGG